MLKGYVHLIKADYNENTGVSNVMIDTDLGAFVGQAKLHDEDKDYASKYTGCRYAETRATIKYLKMKQKYILGQLKVLHMIKETSEIDRLILKLDKELNDVELAIKVSQESLTKDIEQRPELIKRIYSNKEGK